MRGAADAATYDRRTMQPNGGASGDMATRPLTRGSQALLGVIAVLGTLPMIYYGAVTRIEYDGWLHLFIARLDVWSHFWREVANNAHPPLYFLLLKLVALFGTERLVYRSVSIAAAAVAVVALGVAMARVSRVRAVPLLCALAFGLATSTAMIANELRSYMLAATFLMLALPPYLDLVGPGGSRRSRVLFVVFVTLAFLTHYGVLPVFVAALAAPCIVALVFPSYRRAWRAARGARWRADVATVVPPLLLMVAANLSHMRRFARPMSHLSQYYYHGDEPLWRYAGRAMVQQIELFSPIALAQRGPLVQGLAVAVVLAVPVLLVALLRRERESPLPAVLPALLLALTAAHFAGSIVGRYPFGGALRHQFFVFPFALATLFLLLDRLLARLPAATPRRLGVGLVAIAALSSAALQWRVIPAPRAELFTGEYAIFRAQFPAVEAVYLDGFNLTAFFTHTQDWTWAYEGATARERLHLLRVSNGDDSFLVMRDMRRWNAELDEPQLYAIMRAGLEAADATSLAVFHLDQQGLRSPAPTPAEQYETSAAMVRLGRAQGFAPRTILYDGHNVFALLEVPVPNSGQALLAPELLGLEGYLIRAEPNPIQVCAGPPVGLTTIHWSFPGKTIEIRLNAPDGKLWGAPGSSGASETGRWVTDGMTFFVQDRGSGAPLSPAGTLAAITVRLTDEGCPGRLVSRLRDPLGISPPSPGGGRHAAGGWRRCPTPRARRGSSPPPAGAPECGTAPPCDSDPRGAAIRGRPR